MGFRAVALGGPAETVWKGTEVPGETFLIYQMDKTSIEDLTAEISTYSQVPAVVFTKVDLSGQDTTFTSVDLGD